jgi:Ca-activated chloride channel homolog
MSLALVEQTIAALSPDDEVSVVTFARDAQVLLAWTAPLPFPSFDWGKLRPVGPTALVAGVRNALPMLDTASRRRRAMLVVSDGEENDSAVSVARLATTRRQSEALVYGFATAIRIDDRERSVDGVGYMRAIVGDSGGYAEPIRVPSDVPAAVSRLAVELSQQITIGYVSTHPPNGRYRRIKVEHRDKSWRVRHRAGYIASPLK